MESGRAESAQMEVYVPKQHIDGGQAFEVMSDVEFVCHTHAAVQLDGVLTYKSSGFANLHLERAQDFPRACIVTGIQVRCGHHQ